VNATWYIEQSRDKMKNAFAALDDYYQMLRDGAERGKLDAEKRQLETFVQMKERRLSQFANLQAAREAARDKRDSFKLAAVSMPSSSVNASAGHSPGIVPCADAQIAERTLDEMNQEIRALLPL
jgi:DNA replicative helicase MCM subunit Mcm2 (Cdc46/Mcm family)